MPRTEPLAVADVAEDFRLALRGVASTVTLLTVAHAGMRYGMTATAVAPVSMAPPALLVCVNRSAATHAALLASGKLCVNVLGAEHGRLCDAFSGGADGEERFAIGDWARGWCDLPYLVDAQANIFVAIDRQLAYGTHDVLIGEVREVRRRHRLAPLLYFDGAPTTVAHRNGHE